MKKVRVWDLPVRLFHWSLASLVVAAVITEKIGGDAIIWHFRCGYAALTLVLFRIVWGLVGSKYARFSNFLRAPAAILAYAQTLRGAAKGQYPGHNPLGGWSVCALLGAILLQAVSGLFANDDIANEGPLAQLVSKAWSDKLTWLHTEVGSNLVYLVVGLHLAAIAYYFFIKKENLTKAMLSGDKELAGAAEPGADGAAMRWLALAILAVCAAAVSYVVNR